MTIKEIIDLYHREGFSKEQLVEYILNGGGNRYFPSNINNV